MTRKASSLSRKIEDMYPVLAPASLFEEDFSIDWLQTLTGEKASTILAALEAGAQKGWVKNKEPGIYAFANSRDRQRLLNLLPSEERPGLHRKISMLIWQAEGMDSDRKAVEAANHLLQITNDLVGCAWLKRAGDVFFREYRVERALACYTKILGDLAGIDGEEADLLFVESAIQFSKPTRARHETAKVLAILQEAVGRAVRSNKQALLPILKMHQAKNEWLRSRYRPAISLFEEGWSMASASEDARLLRAAYRFRTFFHYWLGRFRDVLSSYESLMPQIDTFPGTQYPLHGVVFAGYSYCHTGKLRHGLGLLDALRRNCQERKDRQMESWAVAQLAAIMLDTRQTKDAFEYAQLALELASEERVDMVLMFAKMQLAFLYSLQDDPDKSASLLQEFRQLSRKSQVTVWPYPYLMELSWTQAQQDPKRFADSYTKELVRRNIAGMNIFVKGIAYRFQALLKEQEGLAEDKIRNALKLSLKWLEASGSDLELARSQLEMARFELSLGDEKRAAEFAQLASEKLSRYNDSLFPGELRFLLPRQDPQEKDIRKELLRLGQEVVSIRSNREVVQHILTSVNQLTGAERGAIFSVDSKVNPSRLLLKASKNITPEQISHPDFKTSIELIETVARTREGKLLRGDSKKRKALSKKEGITSRICVPMILRGQVVGAMYHDNLLLGSEFHESNLGELTYFAALGAYALENAAAYEEINRLNTRLRQEKIYLEERGPDQPSPVDIVGESEALRAVLKQISQVASTDSAVLILGETGVGKGLVAKEIHSRSARKNGPFICVQCSTLPESLITSELFGHEKGAFTGATERRLGRFELADGGTIFLDEIAEMSLDLQVRLLRILETKHFERVGGAQTLRSDFRLVAATNRNLEQEVRTNRFRADLYFRLNVFPIYVPPLRERKEDVPTLAHYFLGVYARQIGKNFTQICDEDLEMLKEYDWPGNVRELQNVIERSVILSPEPTLKVLWSDIRRSASFPEQGEALSLKEVERRHILWALDQTGWKVQGPGGAAEILAIHRSTLQSRMKKLGIKRPAKSKKHSTGTSR